MIAPKDWTRFGSFSEKLHHLKKLNLVPKSRNYIECFHYSGAYVEEPIICSIEGFVDKTVLVIKVEDELHCINAKYLHDMQNGYYRLPEEYIVLDLETTGFSPQKDKIIEFAGVKYQFGEEIDSFSTLINPNCEISFRVQQVNNISNDLVKDAPCMKEAFSQIYSFLGNTPLVAHNAQFDIGFLKKAYEVERATLNNAVFDTVKLCRKAFPELDSHRLSVMKEHLNIRTETAHRALPDVYATAEVFKACVFALSTPEPNNESDWE